MYRGTVRGPEVTFTTPDPCDQYEATVASQYMMPNLTCTGNGSPSKPLGGELLHYSVTPPPHPYMCVDWKIHSKMLVHTFSIRVGQQWVTEVDPGSIHKEIRMINW